MSEQDDRDKARDLLNKIDEMARDYDHVEYGLPIFGETVDELEQVVIKTLRAQRAAALEEVAIAVIDEYRSKYPEDIFISPPSGKHGQTVDACSARAIRFACDRLKELLRARAQQAREGGT